LQEAEEWAAKHKATPEKGLFSRAEITKPENGAGKLKSPRSYSLSLSPQLVHTRSQLLSQLVSSRAYRQVEFQAVGSFFVYQPSTFTGGTGSEDGGDSVGPLSNLTRIPSTREDVFSSTSIPVRAKRSLMKFLKFVLDYESEVQSEIWQPRAEEPLSEFLGSAFNFTPELQSYVIALTLSLDGKITVRDGLGAISRHLTSMGVFGPGFAAVYAKWGGGSEIAQVACRAGAVGGGVYMLGTGVRVVESLSPAKDNAKLSILLTNDMAVKAKSLVRGSEEEALGAVSQQISRLIAIVASPLKPLFVQGMEGAPTPAVAVIAFPPSPTPVNGEQDSQYPVYVSVHSSDTGECPSNQSKLDFSMIRYLVYLRDMMIANFMNTYLHWLSNCLEE
jgi:Rab proteins geranylgeranyltransferase component A